MIFCTAVPDGICSAEVPEMIGSTREVLTRERFAEFSQVDFPGQGDGYTFQLTGPHHPVAHEQLQPGVFERANVLHVPKHPLP